MNKSFKQYLFNNSPYSIYSNNLLNEDNFEILNEVYFGRGARIQELEKLIKLLFLVYKEKFRNTSYINKKLVDEIERRYKMYHKDYIDDMRREKNIPLEIKNNINKIIDSINEKNKDYFKEFDLNIDTKMFKDLVLKIIFCIEQLIMDIFGIFNFKIKLTMESSPCIFRVYNVYYKNNNKQEQNADDIHHDENLIYNPMMPSNIIHRFEDTGHGINNLLVNTPYFTKYISINDYGIRFKPKEFPVIAIMGFPSIGKVMEAKFTPEEIISIILHEIGHLFSMFFIDGRFPPFTSVQKLVKDVKDTIKISSIHQRRDEKFADQFVSLFGYSSEYIEASNKMLSYLNYMAMSNNRYIDPSTGYIDDEDIHPNEYHRGFSLLARLKAEQRSPTLTDDKRKELNRDIKKTTKKLKFCKNNPYIMDNFNYLSDEQYQEYIKNHTAKHKIMVTKDIIDPIERDKENQARVKPKEMTKLFDHLYTHKFDYIGPDDFERFHKLNIKKSHAKTKEAIQTLRKIKETNIYKKFLKAAKVLIFSYIYKEENGQKDFIDFLKLMMNHIFAHQFIKIYKDKNQENSKIELIKMIMIKDYLNHFEQDYLNTIILPKLFKPHTQEEIDDLIENKIAPSLVDKCFLIGSIIPEKDKEDLINNNLKDKIQILSKKLNYIDNFESYFKN